VTSSSDAIADTLARAGVVAPDEEASELRAAAADNSERLDALVARRIRGEPLAWITGSATFCDVQVTVLEGVYVPRWQSEGLALRAAALLPDGGIAIDCCTGSGALALVLKRTHPNAQVLATEIDPAAIACAQANEVEVLEGDLLDPVPDSLRGRVDVIVGVVPYVPTGELGFLPSDTFAFESPRAYDGGPDGLRHLRRVVARAPELLRDGGVLLLELGGEEADALGADLDAAGFGEVAELRDDEGDLRGIEMRLTGRRRDQGGPRDQDPQVR
jgi:release factor glutamine methyltransferase